VDRFMSEARSITNLIGNGVATLVIARSERAFDDGKRAAAVAAVGAERRAAVAAA
jgi:aerobic C4-dicarboxylate transport protein